MKHLVLSLLLLSGCASEVVPPPPPHAGVYCPGEGACPNDAGAPCIQWDGDYCIQWQQQPPPDAGSDAPCIMSAPDVCIP